MIMVGDTVGRKSYGCDIIFKVKELYLNEGVAVLRGITTRLEATAPINDLVYVSKDDQRRFEEKHTAVAKKKIQLLQRGISMQRERALKTSSRSVESEVRKGRILHLDGDPDYVHECQDFYNRLHVSARCVYIPEVEQQDKVTILCRNFKADVVVLTGHDGKLKHFGQSDDLTYYHNTKAFLKAVQAVRSDRPDKDDLAVVAGACQSYYEVLIAGGANYASSPSRILIDIFDPCIVAVQIASLGVDHFLQPENAVKATEGKGQGMGGVETQGKARILYPAVKWEGDA